MLTRATCETCRFWSKSYTAERPGNCRRFPPQIWREPAGFGMNNVATAFPKTRAGEWCGEHLSRDSDTRRQAETGTGSVRSTGSATPQGDRP